MPNPISPARPTFSYLLLPAVLFMALAMTGCGKDSIEVFDEDGYTYCAGGVLTEYPTIDDITISGHGDGLWVEVYYSALPGVTHELVLLTGGGEEAGGGMERHPMPCGQEYGTDTGGYGDLPAVVEMTLYFTDDDEAGYVPGETTTNRAEDLPDVTAVVIASKISGEVYACSYLGDDMTNAFLVTKTECGPYPPTE
jgi:hypothetical protein